MLAKFASGVYSHNKKVYWRSDKESQGKSSSVGEQWRTILSVFKVQQRQQCWMDCLLSMNAHLLSAVCMIPNLYISYQPAPKTFRTLLRANDKNWDDSACWFFPSCINNDYNGKWIKLTLKISLKGNTAQINSPCSLSGDGHGIFGHVVHACECGSYLLFSFENKGQEATLTIRVLILRKKLNVSFHFLSLFVELCTFFLGHLGTLVVTLFYR